MGFGANPEKKACREAEKLGGGAVVLLDKEVTKRWMFNPGVGAVDPIASVDADYLILRYR